MQISIRVFVAFAAKNLHNFTASNYNNNNDRLQHTALDGLLAVFGAPVMCVQSSLMRVKGGAACGAQFTLLTLRRFNTKHFEAMSSL